MVMKTGKCLCSMFLLAFFDMDRAAKSKIDFELFLFVQCSVIAYDRKTKMCTVVLHFQPKL